jgi:dihydroflavonol-4-reductase
MGKPLSIFITGGDGFLGSNLVRILLKRKHRIKVLVQSGRQMKTLKGVDVELVQGDLLDFNSLKNAVGSSDVIFHLAASTSIWPSRSELVNKINIEGTRNIIQLAKDLNVKRLVHVGTANTFSFGSKELPGTEDSKYLGGQYGLDYMDSKYKAHQLVLEAVKDGVPAVVVNPTFMLGAYDSAPGPGAMILAIQSQKLPGYAPGGRNYICVKDAASGIANALEMGTIGESYIIGNENLSYKEVFGKMSDVIGVSAPKRKIPEIGVLVYGRLGSFIGRITGKKPTVSYPMAKISCDSHYFSAAKAVRELKLPQSPIEEGIKESYDWLKANGYIKAS